MIKKKANLKTKVCTKCLKEKPVEKFHWKKKDIKRNKQCGKCINKYCKMHYGKNRKKYKEKARIHNQRYIQEGRMFVRGLKMSNSCVKCAESHPDVLEFDHVEPSSKSTDISYMAQHAYSLETIEKEIAKCVLLCANCHRKRTALQKDWYQYKIQGEE